LRKNASVLPLFVLNPAINNLYIANAHNDLVPIACIVVGLVIVPRLPILSAILVVVVFAGTSQLKQRFGWAAATVIGVAVAALLFGGPAYLHDLFARASLGGTLLQAGGMRELGHRIVERLLLGVSLLALAAAFVREWIVRSAAFAFVGMSPVYIYSWYAGWGLPYAVLEDGALTAFLVLLPFVSMLLETEFPATGAVHGTMLAVLLAIIVEFASRRVRLKPAGKASAPVP